MLHDSHPTPRLDILGIPISRLGLEEAIDYCATRASKRSGGYVCFVNVHTITEANERSDVAQALTEATLAVADGLPLVWVSKFRSEPIGSRVCGPDFMDAFLRKYPDLNHGFLGGIQGQAEKLADRFSLSATCYSPPMRPFSKEAAEEDWKTFVQLNGSKPLPSAVWIGLGAPKQELWMQVVSKIAPDTLFFGVGAAFDFLTCTKRRAPIWVQKMGIEWFFRLYQEPKRLLKRYFHTNLFFIFHILKDSIGRPNRDIR